MRGFIASLYRKSAQVDRIAENLGGDRSIRTVREGQRHVTMLFFPEITGEEAESICRAVSEIRSKGFSSRTSGVTGFPSPRRANVLVLLIDSPELVEIQNTLARKCPAKFDQKKFRPHITLARSRGRPADVSKYEKLGKNIELDFESVVFYRSELTPEGPVYTEICSTQLI